MNDEIIKEFQVEAYKHGFIIADRTLANIQYDEWFNFERVGKRGNTNCSAVIHKNHKAVIHDFGCHNDTSIRLTGYCELTDAEKKTQNEQDHERTRQERKEQIRIGEECRNRFNQPIWGNLKQPTGYMVRKGLSYIPTDVKGDGREAFYGKGNLLIPMYDGNGLVANYQTIYDEPIETTDGKTIGKLFQQDAQVNGTFYPFKSKDDEFKSMMEIINSSSVILCEGYATGASIYEAYGHEKTVIVAWNCGNLKYIAPWFKGRDALVFADNDPATKARTGHNPGIEVAEKIKKTFGIPYVYCPSEGENVDANDYAQAHGKDALRALIENGDGSREDDENDIIIPTADFFKQTEPEKFIVDGFIPRDTIGLIWGASGSGKSFVALDIALSLATRQKQWYGKDIGTDCQQVLYVCAEGFQGVRHRVIAYFREHGLDESLISNFAVISHSVKIDDAKTLADLIKSINRKNLKPSLIFIDTARRCMSGQENSSDDVQAFVDSVERLKLEIGATIIAIHHTAKSSEGTTSPRGSAVWTDALDFSYEVSKSDKGIIRVQSRKNKDGDCTFVRSFKLKEHTLEKWVKSNGQPIISCTLERVGLQEDDAEYKPSACFHPYDELYRWINSLPPSQVKTDKDKLRAIQKAIIDNDLKADAEGMVFIDTELLRVAYDSSIEKKIFNRKMRTDGFHAFCKKLKAKDASIFPCSCDKDGLSIRYDAVIRGTGNACVGEMLYVPTTIEPQNEPVQMELDEVVNTVEKPIQPHEEDAQKSTKKGASTSKKVLAPKAKKQKVLTPKKQGASTDNSIAKKKSDTPVIERNIEPSYCKISC